MSHDQFWKLLAKKLASEASEEELKELERLMKAYPDLLYAAQHIQDLWNLKSKDQSPSSEEAFHQHLLRMKSQGLDIIPLEKPKDEPASTKASIIKSRKTMLSLAAVGCALLVLSIVWLSLSESMNDNINPDKRFSEVSTHSGSKSKLILPDSTIVWLNSGSKLTYNEHFGIKNRNLTLMGEAYFDVRKSHIPFIIHTNGIQIKVLGTAFNVRSYPNDSITETSLIRGRVEITIDKHPEDKYILRPDQKLKVYNNQVEKQAPIKRDRNSAPLIVLEQLNHLKNNIIAETSWIDNKLVFQDESFGEIAKKMERWYGVTIHIEDAQIEAAHFTGVFDKESISQALEAIQFSTPFHYTIKKDTINITK